MTKKAIIHVAVVLVPTVGVTIAVGPVAGVLAMMAAVGGLDIRYGEGAGGLCCLLCATYVAQLMAAAP